MFLSDGQPVFVSGDALADTTPLLADASYYSQIGLQLSGAYASYAAIYKNQVWPHTIVKKIGRAVARLPVPVFRKNDSGRTRLSPALGDGNYSAYAELMARPNPKLDPFMLWLWTSSTVEVYGEAMWLKLRDDTGRVRELHPMNPTNVIIRRLPDGEIIYLYTAGTRNTAMIPAIPQVDVVHFKEYNPDNLARGISPLEPLRQTLLSEDAVRRGAAALWKNGARPSVALTHPNKLGDDALKRLKAQWDSVHSGVDNWAKTVVLEEGMTPTILQLNAQEMEYIDMRKLNREEVCAVYDMPPPAVHILDRATFSNITEQFRSLYRDTMAPRLGMYESVLQHQLAVDFAWEGPVYAEFLLDEVLRGDFEQRAQATAQAIQTGQLMPSEAREMGNRPFVEGSDQLLVNSALVPLHVVEAMSPGTGEDVQVYPQRLKAISAASLRRVEGRLNVATDVHALSANALLAGIGDEDDREQIASLLRAAQERDVDVPTLRRWLNATADLFDLSLPV